MNCTTHGSSGVERQRLRVGAETRTFFFFFFFFFFFACRNCRRRHRLQESTPLARTLKANRSFILGHLVRSRCPTPFYMLVARGVEEYAQKHGYTALTYNVNTDAMAERKAIETFSQLARRRHHLHHRRLGRERRVRGAC